jgi:AcrR family transcriptional regulator
MPPSETVTRTPSPNTPSRRDQHKSRTRQALRQAALELFAAQGFDATTTEEIAERAGVSVRTFFRYFPTKELVLFHGRYDFMQTFATGLQAQPESVSDVEAMRAAFLASSPGFADRRKALRLYERAVASSHTLRGREQILQFDDIHTIAEAIGRRRGDAQPDEACALLAAIGLLTYRRALGRWLAGPDSGDFADLIADEFDLLEVLFRGT